MTRPDAVFFLVVGSLDYEDFRHVFWNVSDVDAWIASTFPGWGVMAWREIPIGAPLLSLQVLAINLDTGIISEVE